MTSIRFACCWCGQHLQCDPIYAKQTIACPACSKRIVVPQLLTLERSPVIPVAKRAPAVERDLGLWTEDEWQAHESEYDKVASRSDRVWIVPTLAAVTLPFLVIAGANDLMMWSAVVIGVVVSAWAGEHNMAAAGENLLQRMVGLFGGAFCFLLLSIVTLFGGCCWPGRVQNL